MELILGKKIKEYRWTYGLSMEDLIAKAGLSLDIVKLRILEDAKEKASWDGEDLSRLLVFSKWPVEYFQGILDKVLNEMEDFFRGRDSKKESKVEELSKKYTGTFAKETGLRSSTLKTSNFDRLYWMFNNCYLLEKDPRFNIGLIGSHDYYMALLAAQFYDFVRDAPDRQLFTDYHLLIRRKLYSLKKSPSEYSIGEKLKMARKHCKLSLNDLSSQLSISSAYLEETEKNLKIRLSREDRKKIGDFIKGSSIFLSNSYYFKIDCLHREMYNDFLKGDKFNFSAREMLPEFDYLPDLPKKSISKIHLTLEKHFL